MGSFFWNSIPPGLFVSSSFYPGFHPAVPRAMDLAVGLEGRESWRVGVWLVEGCGQVCCWWGGGQERNGVMFIGLCYFSCYDSGWCAVQNGRKCPLACFLCLHHKL